MVPIFRLENHLRFPNNEKSGTLPPLRAHLGEDSKGDV
jgi:hypothetical protein